MKLDNKSHTLSVVLAVFNEEEYISRCLESVADIADEIIVVDGESTDSTAEISKSLGALVISTTNKSMFHTNKQMAIDAATCDWILQLDADEVVDNEMRNSLKKLKKLRNPNENGFYLKRKNYFLGRFLKKGGQYPDPVIRLFRKNKGSLPQKSVHEQISIDGVVGWLDGHLLHYNAPTFSRYITNANRYTSLTAQQYLENGVSLSVANDFLYLVGKPLATFLKLYIRHRGYVDGFPGLVFALFSGLHHSLSYMKLYDLKRNATST